MRYGLFLLVICSCRIGFDEVGRAGTDPDAAGLDPGAACAWGPWSAPAPVEGFEGGEWERSPEQRSDRLEVFYVRYETVNSVINAQVWSAARATRAVPYSGEGAVAVLNDPASDDIDPALSADGRVLMFSSGRTGTRRAYEARRPMLGAAFAPPLLARGLETHTIASLDLTADGLGLYFDEGADLWFSRRPALDQPFGGSMPLGITGSLPTVSRDQLEIFYNRNFELLARSRASVGDPFADEVTIVISGSTGYGSADLSADGTELLLIVSDQLQRITRACL